MRLMVDEMKCMLSRLHQSHQGMYGAVVVMIRRCGRLIVSRLHTALAMLPVGTQMV